jgi:hypothetical protein
MRVPLVVATLIPLAACHIGRRDMTIGDVADAINGTYATRITEQSSTCAFVPYIERSAETDVYATKGAQTFRLTYAGRPFDAHLRGDAYFSTQAMTVPSGQQTENVAIEGRFIQNGFAARATVSLNSRSGRCSYVLLLQGSKL